MVINMQLIPPIIQTIGENIDIILNKLNMIINWFNIY